MLFDLNIQEDFPSLYNCYLSADSHISANMLQNFAQSRNQTFPQLCTFIMNSELGSFIIADDHFRICVRV